MRTNHAWRTSRLIALALGLAAGRNTLATANGPDDEITVLSNLNYRDGAMKQTVLDLAMPEHESSRARPAIVVIHGGGWIEGDKSSFSTPGVPTPGNIRDFARQGFVAATINYRLSGDAPYPAALDDCRCAVRWLRANARRFGIDAERIGAWGNSAGGHLALLLAMMPQTRPALGEPYMAESSRVQAAASDSGPVDLLYQHEHNELRGVVEKFLGGAPTSNRGALYREASPVSYVSAKLPPLLLIYGETDEQVSVQRVDAMVADLSRQGARDLTYIRLANVGHCPHSLKRIGFLPRVVSAFFARTLKLDAAQ